MRRLWQKAGRWAAVRLQEVAYAEREREIVSTCRSFGERVSLRMPVIVYAPEKLSIGSDVGIGEFVVLRANGGMTIGDRVMIAAHAVLTTRGHPAKVPRKGVVDAPILIENDVWIGAGVVVLPGVTIGRGSIVAAGAVVTRSVEPFTVVGGIPARSIRRIEEEAEA